ncbi:MAG: hypothetical protein EXR69_13380 [Myxococcales bacterium]|nr:hypothetical protein [Myxococcales bacterium]
MPSSELPVQRVAGRILLFCAPLLVLGGWLERGLAGVENSYSAKVRGVGAVMKDVEVLVTGGSGALDAIDPSGLSVPAYNLANASQSLHYDCAILSTLIEDTPKLRAVVIGAPLWYLSKELKNSPEAWRQHFYAVFWRVPMEDPPKSFITIQQHSYTALYTPPAAMEYAAAGFPPIDGGLTADGWEPLEVPSPEVAASGLDPIWVRQHVAGHLAAMRTESEVRNLAAVAALSERLNERGVPLYFGWLPVSAGYNAEFGPDARAHQRQMMERLKADSGVRLFDYSTDPRFSDSDFYNADHMNRVGAQKLTAVLRDEVLAPVLSPPVLSPPVLSPAPPTPALE